MRTIKIATRGSKLALAQASLVKEKVEAAGFPCELLTVSTRGDRHPKDPLVHIGGDGLFVREVEHALLEGRADIAVHSAKDLPYETAEGLVIAGTPDADDARDCLLRRKETTEVHTIGTGSPRRKAELKRLYPAAETKDIRGNVDTRVKKLMAGDYDAIVLSKAGLNRLQIPLEGLCADCFSVEEMIPAPCQGILAAECREEDASLIELLASLSSAEDMQRFQMERQVFTALRADCSTPIGVHVSLSDDRFDLWLLTDGRREHFRGTVEEFDALCGRIVAYDG